eukprot:COSAG05_NODE_398_length_10293_cov_11.919176_10_plen_80_part_00
MVKHISNDIHLCVNSAQTCMVNNRVSLCIGTTELERLRQILDPLSTAVSDDALVANAVVYSRPLSHSSRNNTSLFEDNQ